MSEQDAAGTQVAMTGVETTPAELTGAPPVQPAVASRRALSRLNSRSVAIARRLGMPGIAGIAALLFCAAYIQSALLPQYARVQELREAVRGASSTPAHAAALAPAEQASRFVDSLPDRNALPAMLAAIVQESQAAGLSLDRGAYQWNAEKNGPVARYQLTLPVTGSYPAVRKFVDSTLVAVPAAALAGITLERPNVGDGTVSANLRFEIFVRTSP